MSKAWSAEVAVREGERLVNVGEAKALNLPTDKESRKSMPKVATKTVLVKGIDDETVNLKSYVSSIQRTYIMASKLGRTNISEPAGDELTMLAHAAPQIEKVYGVSIMPKVKKDKATLAFRTLNIA